MELLLRRDAFCALAFDASRPAANCLLNSAKRSLVLWNPRNQCVLLRRAKNLAQFFLVTAKWRQGIGFSKTALGRIGKHPPKLASL